MAFVLPSRSEFQSLLCTTRPFGTTMYMSVARSVVVGNLTGWWFQMVSTYTPCWKTWFFFSPLRIFDTYLFRGSAPPTSVPLTLPTPFCIRSEAEMALGPKPTVIFCFHWSPSSLAEVRSKHLVIREDLMQRAVLLAERFCLCRGCNEWKVRRHFTCGKKVGYPPVPKGWYRFLQNMAVLLESRCWHFPLDCWCRDLFRTLRSWAKHPGNRTPENAEQEQKWIDTRGELGSFWALGYQWMGELRWILGWLIYKHNFLVNHIFFGKVLLDYGLLNVINLRLIWYHGDFSGDFMGIPPGSSDTSNPMVFFHPIRRSLAVKQYGKASWSGILDTGCVQNLKPSQTRFVFLLQSQMAMDFILFDE